ncbi:hypothetical protein CALCODRAFT_200758 [Calocera cornea HHB12733]|uniref:Uncharacterized protein n=1 Tax=Calocera cornea HHB12733 TaxID=1353952 RepID=A0A165HHJ1_9BASI|nr:hypothetical protein CALCODRAFT_200758 [Calocera cornea HHB12733]
MPQSYPAAPRSTFPFRLRASGYDRPSPLRRQAAQAARGSRSSRSSTAYQMSSPIPRACNLISASCRSSSALRCRSSYRRCRSTSAEVVDALALPVRGTGETVLLRARAEGRERALMLCPRLLVGRHVVHHLEVSLRSLVLVLVLVLLHFLHLLIVVVLSFAGTVVHREGRGAARVRLRTRLPPAPDPDPEGRVRVRECAALVRGAAPPPAAAPLAHHRARGAAPARHTQAGARASLHGSTRRAAPAPLAGERADLLERRARGGAPGAHRGGRGREGVGVGVGVG